MTGKKETTKKAPEITVTILELRLDFGTKRSPNDLMNSLAFASQPNLPGKAAAGDRPAIPAEESLCPVLSNDWLNAEYKHMVVEAPAKSLAARPGQFFNMLCPSPDDGELWL